MIRETAQPEEQHLKHLIEAGDHVQAEAFAALARPTGKGKVKRVEHGILFSTGLPSRTFNGLILTTLPADPENAISTVKRFAGQLKVPWSLAGRAEVIDGMKPAVSSAGLQEFDSEPGMILDSLSDVPRSHPEGLRVERQGDKAGIRKCFLTMADGYEIPSEVLAPLVEEQVLQAYLEDPALVFHIGYAGGSPVAASIGVVSEIVAYVFMASTVPAFRRRGFGEALTWSAVRAGKERGCNVSYLRATEMGRPVYEKMGYREVTRHLSFSL